MGRATGSCLTNFADPYFGFSFTFFELSSDSVLPSPVDSIVQHFEFIYDPFFFVFKKYFTTTMAFSTAAANISQAINFLTLPLIMTQTADLVATVQSILRSTVSAALAPCRGQLILSFSPNSLPPRPILAACIACDFSWDEWMTLLGNRDFDLIIETHDVLVTYFDLSRPYTITIWSEPVPNPTTRPLLAWLGSFNEPQVPISKLGQRTSKRSSHKAAINSTLPRTQTRTLAQQLLEENHKQEADEIFDMISKTSILSPTPTRMEFPVLRLPSLATELRSTLSSPEAISPGNSPRPSSRSSTFSSLSFSDDEGSITSASSIASFDMFSPTKFQSKPLDKLSPVFVPHHLETQLPTQDEQQSVHVVVDVNKKDKTKYLYQGGCTTVVTGGVMLGSTAPPKKRDAVPKYGNPAAGGKNTFIPQSKPTTKNASAFQGWRRAVVSPV